MPEPRAPMTYANPVIPGFHPDPSICRVGDSSYLVTSSFEYFPGIPIFHSTDLVSWQQIGHCLTRPSQLDLLSAPASGGIYAPTIRWHDGRFYVTSTNATGGGHFIVSAECAEGPWSDPVWIRQDGIDPSLYFENGACFFTSNVEPDPAGPHEASPGFVRGAQQSIVDPMTGEVHSDVRFLWGGSGGSFPEAPHLFRRGRYYYLLMAEGGTEGGHMVTVARADSPWGPWEGCPRNPILSHRSSPSPVQATGHADFVELPDGTWWAVLLGTRPVGMYHHLGRETFLAPMTWDEAGWPVIGNDGCLPERAVRPALPLGDQVDLHTVDEFDEVLLAPRWITLRRPLTAQEVSLETNPGRLTMVGGADTPDDPLLVFVGRRQQHFNCSITADLDFTPAGRDEAGLTVRIDERHHVDLAVLDRAGRRVVALRQRIGPLSTVTAEAVVDDGPLRLRIDAEPDHYSFSVCSGDARIVELGSTETRYLSSEVAGGFTGVVVGMYATGNGRECSTPALWRRFEYRPL